MAHRDENYSTQIRLCTGSINGGPGSEPYPYAWGEASMSEGEATLHKIFFFTTFDNMHFTDSQPLSNSEARRYPHIPPRGICPVEVFYAKGFPARHSRLTDLYDQENKWYHKYHYTGNGTLTHIPDSEIWIYDAEYTTKGSLLQDDDRTDEDDNTDPWDRRPWDVSLDFPETVKPFRFAYQKGTNKKFSEEIKTEIVGGVERSFKVRRGLNPVVNTAKDRILAQTTVYGVQLNFTYALKPRSDIDITTIRSAQGSINKKEIKLCGLKIPAESGRIISLRPELILENTDASGNKKKSYWQVQASVLILSDPDDTFNTKLYNTGSRALFRKDATVDGNGRVIVPSTPATKANIERESIFRWFTFSTTHGQLDPDISRNQFGSKRQMIAARQKYNELTSTSSEKDKMGKPLKEAFGPFDYEQVDDMPLDENGFLDLDAINPSHQRFGQYNTLEFPEFKAIDWNQNSIFKQVSGSGGKLKW